jgi:DNA processing protein
VVVEGGDKSGSLITARLAAEEGRDVFAVPGPATSALSAAPHRLLQMGAVMVERAEDILQASGLLTQAVQRIKELESSVTLPQLYQDVLSFLSVEPVPKEILAQRLNKDASLLSSLLFEMELKGLIRSVPGGGVLKT